MTLPFEEHEPGLFVTASPVARKHPWRENWPLATIALGAVFMLVWLAALTLLFVLRI